MEVPTITSGVEARESKDSRRSNFTAKLYRFLWAHRKLIIKITFEIIRIVFRSDSGG